MTSAPTPGRKEPGRRGLVIVYTGNGKGKTTAAIGLAVRAAGNRMRVFFLQFIKGRWKTGERDILRAIPGVDLEVTGLGFTLERLRDPRIPLEDHAAAAAHGWSVAQQVVMHGEYDLVVLDELLGAIKAGLVPLPEVLALVRTKPAELHLVLTGRDAPPELVEAADLVSEVQPIKHPYDQGTKAQRGIEFGCARMCAPWRLPWHWTRCAGSHPRWSIRWSGWDGSLEWLEERAPRSDNARAAAGLPAGCAGDRPRGRGGPPALERQCRSAAGRTGGTGAAS